METISWSQYSKKFNEILEMDSPTPPYNKEAYLNYVKLNKSRQNRWLKKGVLSEEIKNIVSKLKSEQKWIVITEPWCGDASHSLPFLKLIADLSTKIDLQIVYRDSPPEIINEYLTDNGKAIPKLIIRDKNDEDLAIWGPRPEPCQKLFKEMRANNTSQEEQKITLQNWYNNDKGQTLQDEIKILLENCR